MNPTVKCKQPIGGDYNGPARAHSGPIHQTGHKHGRKWHQAKSMRKVPSPVGAGSEHWRRLPKIDQKKQEELNQRRLEALQVYLENLQQPELNINF